MSNRTVFMIACVIYAILFFAIGWSAKVATMSDDPCEECRLCGDDYSYDKDGNLISNCYDCPMNPHSYAWMGGDGND